MNASTGRGHDSRARRALHVLVLWNFAVAQPLLDLLSRNGEFFVAHRSSALDIALLVLVLCLLSPAVLIVVEMMARLVHRRLGQILHFSLIAGLIGCSLLPLLKRADALSGAAPAIIAGLLGLSAAIAYHRFRPLRMALTALAPAPAVFVAVFLLSPDVRTILGADRASFVSATPAGVANVPVVMVVFDEFDGMSLLDENRQIDASRYPNFAALARESTWYRNATTVSPLTTEAMPAIVTGRYPTAARLPLASEYPENIFTLLENRYRFNVIETVTQLCPARLCRPDTNLSSHDRSGLLMSDVAVVYLHQLLPADWSAGLPPLNQGWMAFASGGAVAQRRSPGDPSEPAKETRSKAYAYDKRRHFLDFVDSIERTPQPSFHFIHVLLPHIPYQYLPSGRTYGAHWRLAGLTSELWDNDETSIIQAYQRYLLQLGFVDTLVGRLIGRLKETQLYDDSLVIITADHGVSFLAGESRRHLSPTNARSVLPVPLLIKAPNQREGAVTDRNAETVDILPTIAALLEIPLSGQVDGRSLAEEPAVERAEKVAWEKGRRTTWPPAFQAKFESLTHKLSLFGSGTGNDGLFRAGPYAAILIDHSVASVKVTTPGELTVEFDQETLFEDVSLDGHFLPGHVTGRVLFQAPPERPIDLAVAVNGRFVATTRTGGGGTRFDEFSAVIPESAFRPGKNRAEFFLVSRTGAGLNLSRLTRAASGSWQLDVSTDGPTAWLTSPKGQRVMVAADGAKGVVDYACLRDGLSFAGWAADVRHQRVPDVVLAFVDQALVYTGRIDLVRPDVAQALENRAFTNSGFAFDVPAPEGTDRLAEVRLFAASTQRAFELIYSDSCRGDGSSRPK